MHSGELSDDTMRLHVLLEVLHFAIAASKAALLLLASMCCYRCQVWHIKSFHGPIDDNVGAMVIMPAGRVLLDRGYV